MSIAKKIFLAVLSLALVIAGGYVYLDKTRPGTVLGVDEIKEKIEEKLPEARQLTEKLPLEKLPDLEQIENESIKETADTTVEQLETLSEKATEVKNHLNKVIDEVKEDEGASLHEKAFEYGQYLYCQQVVKDYDTK